MAETRTVVDVVRAESGSKQTLEEIILLVGALCRLKHGEALGAALVTQPHQLLGGELECLVPRRFAERFVPRCGRCHPVAWIPERSVPDRQRPERVVART